MVKYRDRIPPKIKKALIKEAGGKCANPGCVNYRTHIHHIQDWAIYQTHNGKSMITICPTCHDAVHHGTLKIDDETLYRWKGIKRAPTKRDHLYVEPGNQSKLLLGGIAFTGDSGLSVFELSSTNKLSFRLVDEDIFLVNLRITNSVKQEVIRIVDNYVKTDIKNPLKYDKIPGKIRITAPDDSDFLPCWMLEFLRVQEPNYAYDGQLILLDIEVIEPGLVRVQGIWAEDKFAIVITKERIAIIKPEGPRSLCGQGADTVIKYIGPINTSLFDFKSFWN